MFKLYFLADFTCHSAYSGERVYAESRDFAGVDKRGTCRGGKLSRFRVARVGC